MSETRLVFRRGVLEVVTIVGGILLAFGIDAAWDKRQESLEEGEILASLAAEFEFHRSELVRHKERWERVRVGTERLITATSSGTPPSPIVMDSLLYLFLTPTTFDPRQGAWNAVFVSGRLNLIENRDLRNRLAAWGGVVEEVRDNELAMRDFILNVITPYLAERGVPLSRARALLPTTGLTRVQGDTNWPGVVPDDLEAGEAYRRLLLDPGFEVLVGTRYGWINVEEYADAIAFVDEVLGIIRDELP